MIVKSTGWKFIWKLICVQALGLRINPQSYDYSEKHEGKTVINSRKIPSGDDKDKNVGKRRRMDACKMKQVSFLSKQHLNQKKRKENPKGRVSTSDKFTGRRRCKENKESHAIFYGIADSITRLYAQKRDL